jgi:outer membrane cobalamin receptor
MRSFIKYLVIIPGLLLITANLPGQICYDTLQLKELEIIANQNHSSTTKTTSIDTIARKELSLTNIGELLSAYTPVFVKSYGKGSLSTVSIRGTGASHTKVMWEGFDINSPMLGQTDFSLLPCTFFDEIELKYGSSSLSGTSGALGGSINLKSRNYTQQEHNVKVSQSIGSFSTYQTSVGINLGSSKLFSDTRFFRQSSNNDFSYYNNAILPEGSTMLQTNADFRNVGFIQQLSYKLSDNQTLSFITWNQWNSRNIPEIMPNIEKGGNQDEHLEDLSSRNILGWEMKNSNTNWEAKAAYFHDDIDYYLHKYDSIGNTISLIDSKNTVENLSLAGKMITKTSKGLIVKSDLKVLFQSVNSNNYTGIKNRSLIDVSLGVSKSLLRNLTAEAIIRSQVSDFSVIPFMPMVGVNYKPLKNQDLHLRFIFSRNQNIPTLNALYWYPVGNENLKTEISVNTEMDIDYALQINNHHSLAFSGSIYSSWVDNWIIWRPGVTILAHPENIAKVFARGFELSVKTTGTFGKLNYNVFGEYAYSRSTYNSKEYKDLGLAETQLIYIPEHSAVGYLNLKFHNIQATWSMAYTGARNTSMNMVNYSYNLPHYTLNSVSLGYLLSMDKMDLDLRFKVYNLFDINYQAVLWRAMPGRNYELIISLKF